MFQTRIIDYISSTDNFNIKSVKKSAKNGDIQAQIQYATGCFYGVKKNGKKIIKEDLKQALKYAQKSIEKNNSDGYVLYGLIQLYGKGAPNDIHGAFNSFNSAITADKTNNDAKYLISQLLFHYNYKEIPLETAVNYLKESGSSDTHIVKEAMGELGILFFENKFVTPDYTYSLKFLIKASKTYMRANEYLEKITSYLTEKKYKLNQSSKVENIYNAANYIKSKNDNKITGTVLLLLSWGDDMKYPPAMFDYCSYQLEKNDDQYYKNQIMSAAERLYPPAIDYRISHFEKKLNRETMILVKMSIYFKSNCHQTTAARCIKQDCESKKHFDYGRYFRYRKYADSYDSDDQKYIEELKLKAVKDGYDDEQYAYAVCLENGFNGLKKDPQGALEIYKKLADDYVSIAKNSYSHFVEFGKYTKQDLSKAKSYCYGFDNEGEATSFVLEKMKSEEPFFPFPYNEIFQKLKEGKSHDPDRDNEKMALLLVENKDMIPNFELAKKFVKKIKKSSPMSTAILAYINGNPSAGKPNIKKAEKLFKQALKHDGSNEKIKKLYEKYKSFQNGKFNDDDDDDEIDEIDEIEDNGHNDNYDENEENKHDDDDIEENDNDSNHKHSDKAEKNGSLPKNTTENSLSQFMSGNELYDNYLRTKEIRYLDRSAQSGYPLGQAVYAQHVIKNKLKYRYKRIFSDLQKLSKEGNFTSHVLLGLLYHKGLGTKQNYQEAIKYYSIAIDNFEYQGYAGYAYAYCTGNGFEKDFYMANRYINLAKTSKTCYQRLCDIDLDLFVNTDYNEKFEDIKKNSDVITSNMKKASNLFASATYYEFVKFDYQKAFTNYKKAAELEPNNGKYGRNYAYYLMKSIGNDDGFEEAEKLYKKLGNADDLHNLKIVTHYHNHPYTPFYMNQEAEQLIAKINDETATAEDYIKIGLLIVNNEFVHQQYQVALKFFHNGIEKFEHPLCFYELGRMAENGYGRFFKEEEIITFYKCAAIYNTGDKLFTPENAKGCFKLGQMLVNGYKIYPDLHQGCFYLSKAISLNLNDPELRKEYDKNLENLVTNKNIIDPWDEHLCKFYHVRTTKDESDYEIGDIEIKDFSNPYMNWKVYDPSLAESQNIESTFQTGFQFMKGIGVAKNYDKAFEYLAKAAIAGHPLAKIYFGILAKMCKIPKYEQLYNYNMFASQIQGFSLPYIEMAKVELGLYKNIPKGNKEKAEAYLQKAIDAGDPYALYIRGRYLEDSESLKQSYENGCAKASYFLGKLLLNEKNFDKAFPYIEKAASQGHPKAVFILGYLELLRGNKEKGEELMEKGVTISGNSIIAVKYGLEKLIGQKVTKNESEAVKYFEYAHNLNNLNGTLQLALCLSHGIGCNKDKEKAASLFKIGCKLDIPEFFEPAAECFSELKGLKNWSKSKKYANKAKKVAGLSTDLSTRIIQPAFEIKSIDYSPWHVFNKARDQKMIDNSKYVNDITFAYKLGLYSAIKEIIYQKISGLYFEINEQEAFTLAYQLKALNWPTAYKIIGDLYFNTELFVDKTKTIEYYKKAAEMNSKSGKFKYGYCVANGIGCDQNMELGHSIIDSSGCKYAYNYLKKYTKYKPKVSKQNNNCLTIVEKVINSQFSENDLRNAIKRDIRYAIVMFNKYCWDNSLESRITNESMEILEKIASNGSQFGNYQYGFTLSKRGQLKESIPYLKFAADRQNYQACHILGNILYDESFAQYGLAKVYLEQSAIHLNNADDQYKMTFLTTGQESKDWLEMSAKTNPEEYSLKAAEIFRVGIEKGFTSDKTLATSYYEIAFKNNSINNANDLYRIGKYFYDGDGVKKDSYNAFDFMARASNWGNIDASNFVCFLYEHGKGRATSLPVDHYKKLAGSNHPNSPIACWKLGVYYCEIANKYHSISNYEESEHYFRSCGWPEALENAEKIKDCIKNLRRLEQMKEDERRHQQERENAENNKGIAGFLTVLAVGAILI